MVKYSIFECAQHGELTQHNAYVDDLSRVICGKCGKAGIAKKGQWGKHGLQIY